MNGYGDWTVHELLHAILIHYEAKSLPDSDKVVLELEAAIREHVIREASVGVVKLSHDGVASDYDIIPKETP